MNAAIVTVGNELLAGDIENTNATWLAAELTDIVETAASGVLRVGGDRGHVSDGVGRGDGHGFGAEHKVARRRERLSVSERPRIGDRRGASGD